MTSGAASTRQGQRRIRATGSSHATRYLWRTSCRVLPRTNSLRAGRPARGAVQLVRRKYKDEKTRKFLRPVWHRSHRIPEDLSGLQLTPEEANTGFATGPEPSPTSIWRKSWMEGWRQDHHQRYIYPVNLELTIAASLSPQPSTTLCSSIPLCGRSCAWFKGRAGTFVILADSPSLSAQWPVQSTIRFETLRSHQDESEKSIPARIYQHVGT